MKKIIKEDGKYLFVYTILCMITLILMIVKNYSIEPGNLHLELGFRGKLFIILILVVGAIYYFLLKNIDKKQIKTENLFLWMVIPIGIFYLLAFPIGTIPDERSHFLRAYEVSTGHIMSDRTENHIGGRELPKEIDNIFYHLEEDNVYSWFERASKANITNEKTFLGFSNTSLYAFSCYIPQAFGIFIARIFTSRILVMAYAARICNFLSFIGLMYLAIKFIPFKKQMAILIALLPIVFQEAVSLSPDATTIAISMLLIAYIFYLKERKEKLAIKDFCILGGLCLILALCKIVYIPICFLIYMIPKECFQNTKQKYIILTSILMIAVVINLVWLSFATQYLAEFKPGLNAKEQIHFVLTHPMSYIVVLIRTFDLEIQNYLGGITGDLSMLNVFISDAYKYILLFLLGICIVANFDEEKHTIAIPAKCCMALVFIVIVGLLFTSLYVEWTQVKGIVVEGVQGRYFVPILILLPFLFHNNYFLISKKMPYRIFLTCVLFVNLHAVTMVGMFYK